MNIINQQYELVDVTRLVRHPANPRKGDVAAIGESVRVNGWYGAVVAQLSSGRILAGNHRYLVALEQQAAQVPTIWVDCDDDEALRILLADNRTNDLAGYDEQALADVLRGLDTLVGTGYDQAAVDELLAKLLPAEFQLGAEDQSGELREKFEVIVFCKGEQHQTKTLEFLAKHGYECKALIA